MTSASFAEQLHSILLPHLPSFPYPLPVGRSRSRDNTKIRLPYSCNSNIRMYKYTPSQHFGPHYDDSVKDAATGAKSEWTLLIYLTGIEDGVKGGEVRVCGCICWTIPLKCPRRPSFTKIRKAFQVRQSSLPSLAALPYFIGAYP